MDENTEVNPLPSESRAVRATDKEAEVRIEYTCQMLSEGRRKSEIKRFFSNNYGVGYRQVERYIRQARDRMIEESGKAKNEHVADAYQFYMGILQDSSASITEKLVARRQADDLLGLQAPKRVVEAHVDANDMLELWVDQLTPDQLRAIDTAASVGEVVEEQNAKALRQRQAMNLQSAVDMVQNMDFVDDNETLEEYIDTHGEEKNISENGNK
jgi:hypothetical protein